MSIIKKEIFLDFSEIGLQENVLLGKVPKGTVRKIATLAFQKMVKSNFENKVSLDYIEGFKDCMSQFVNLFEEKAIEVSFQEQKETEKEKYPTYIR